MFNQNLLAMKNFIILVLVLALATSLDAYGQRIPVGRLKEMLPTKESKPEPTKKGPTPMAEFATIYPNAIPVNPNYSDGRGEQYGSFYTDDSYDKVTDYYIREVGFKSVDKEGNKVFNYKAVKGEYDIVKIHTSGQFTPKGILRVLREIKHLSERGIISKDEYLKIEEKYLKVQGFWKTDFCIDIYNKYNQRLDPVQISEAKNQEAQRLAMSGRRDEAVALMQEAVQDTQNLIELMQSPKIVDEWVKCLDEIANAAKDKNNYWNLMISISRTGKG